MEPSPTERDEIVSQFCAMAGTRPSEALEYLETNNWDIEASVTEFFAEQDEALQGGEGGQRLGSDESSIERTLGGAPAGSSGIAQQSSASKKSAPRKKFATLGDFASKRDDSGDEHETENQDFFAGGEKSGLAVQNPDEVKRKIIEKAERTTLPPEETQPRRSYFTGSARTLGGDDAPSRVIEDPNAGVPQPLPRARRTLHFWADGFSVDDGELYQSDDPRNAEILEGIRRGRAPLSIMNLQPGQDVDVEIQQHNEKYVRPKPKYKPFAGRGQRLGSPTPGIGTHTSAAAATTPSQATREPPKPDVDESQPTVTLQIRLGDGTRLTSRFNTSHTIGDVYQFVSVASPISQSRPWVLMTTFPSKELTNKDIALGDLSEFKRGGVVVQKWQ